jgi:hypothetical protein
MPHYAEPLTDPEEIAFWNEILAHQGETFTTSGRGSRPGIAFTYTIRGAEMFVDRKEKSITRATVMIAYHKAKEFGIVTGPKKLNVFGASYLLPVFKRIGVCE